MNGSGPCSLRGRYPGHSQAGAADVGQYLETANLGVYVPQDAWIPDVLREIHLRPAISNADLVVIEAPGPLALEAVRAEGWPCAPLPVVYAELRCLDMGQTRQAADRLLPRLQGNRT